MDPSSSSLTGLCCYDSGVINLKCVKRSASLERRVEIQSKIGVVNQASAVAFALSDPFPCAPLRLYKFLCINAHFISIELDRKKDKYL